MADSKISLLTEVTTLAAGDMLPVVDVSDTSMAASGTTKRVLQSNLLVDAGVANAKLANMSAATIKGRASGAGTGVPTDLTAAQTLTILGADTVVVTAAEMEASISGSPTRGAVNAQLAAWLMDATSIEMIGTSVGGIRFPTWTTMTTQVVWAPSDTGAGNVIWQVANYTVTDGALPSNAGSVNMSASAAPTVTDRVVVTAASSAINVAATTVKGLRIARIANDAGDTYAADAKFIAVILTKAS